MAGRLQLRMYTINKGKLNEFLDAWRKGVVPLRAKYGFRIEGGWAVENENRFYWLMAYDGDDWDKAEQAYYNSPQRKTLNPDPSQFVAHMELRFVHFESSALS
jgi:hypothetical protein